MNSIAFLVPAASLVALGVSHTDSSTAALAAMTVAMGAGGFSGAGYASNHQDIASKTAPLLFGITNASSSIAGTTAVFLSSALRGEGATWNDIWLSLAAIYVAGAAVYVTWGSAKRQFD